MLYVDGVNVTFISGNDLEIGAELVYKQFVRFGLEIHIGRGGKASKNESLRGHFPKPPPTTITTNQSSIISSSNSLATTNKKTQENALVKRKREMKNAKNTRRQTTSLHPTASSPSPNTLNTWDHGSAICWVLP